MSVTSTATLNINATQATQTLTKVQKQVGDLNKGFASLQNTLGRLALGAFVVNMFRAADAINDVAAATGFTVAEVDALGQAFAANGGSAEVAQDALAKFANVLEDAKTKGGEALDKFRKLGITQEEVFQLNQKDLFKKTLEALGRMPAGARRVAAGMDMIGKASKTVDLNGVTQNYETFLAASEKSAPGLIAAGKLFDNLGKIGKQTANELFQSNDTLVGSLANLANNTEQIAKTFAQLINLVGILGIVLGGLKIVEAANKFTAWLAVLKASNKQLNMITGYSALERSLKQLIQFASFGRIEFAKWQGGTMLLGNALGNLGRALGRFTAFAGGIFLIGQAFAYLFDTSNPVVTVMKLIGDYLIIVAAGLKLLLSLLSPVRDLFIGIKNAIVNLIGQTGFFDWFDRVAAGWNETVDAAKQYLGISKQIQDAQGGFDPAKPLVIEGGNAEKMAEGYFEMGRANRELQKNIDEVTSSYRKQNNEALRNLALQGSFAGMADNTVEVIEAEQEAYQRVMGAVDQLTKLKESAKPYQQEYIANINKEIGALLASIPAAQQAARTRVENLHKIRDAQDDLNKSIELQKIDLDTETMLSGLREQLALVGQYGDELEHNQTILAVTNELQSKLTDYQKQLLDLETRKNQLTTEQYAKELNHINIMIEKAYEYAGARLEAEQQILDAQKAVQENAQAGVKRAIADIANQFKPYEMAQEAVRQGWNRISDAFDTFIDTGKFRFKDFALSIIQDLTKMIAKALLFKYIFEPIMGALGLSIPGRAAGGPVQGKTPYMVGERGPELFVPQGAGKIVPNNQLGSAQPAGPITNNYITNNINAVDAKSVAQLFAENRKTLLGSVKMAEREMPYMAR